MSSLVLCSACRRHVHLGAEACPFCSASLADARSESAPRNRGLSRAAMFAKAAALATGVAGCGGSSSDSTPTDAATDAVADSIASDTKGDTTTGSDTGTTTDTATGSDTGTTADAATDVDDAPTDTGPETPCCPPYGCVFPDAACEGAIV